MSTSMHAMQTYVWSMHACVTLQQTANNLILKAHDNHFTRSKHRVTVPCKEFNRMKEKEPLLKRNFVDIALFGYQYLIYAIGTHY